MSVIHCSIAVSHDEFLSIGRLFSSDIKFRNSCVFNDLLVFALFKRCIHQDLHLQSNLLLHVHQCHLLFSVYIHAELEGRCALGLEGHWDLGLEEHWDLGMEKHWKCLKMPLIKSIKIALQGHKKPSPN